MNRLFRQFRLENWPIWVKLVTAFVIASALPMLLSFLIVRGDIARFTSENLARYVEEKGVQRQQSITDNIEQAQQTLNAFTLDPLITQYLEFSVLSLDTSTYNVLPGLMREVRSRLLDTRSFDQVIITNPEGLVIYSVMETPDETVNEPLVNPYSLGDDLSDSPLVEAGQLALSLEERQRMTIVRQENGQAEIYLTGVVYGDEEPITFVSTRINRRAVIHNYLRQENGFRETFSYLLTYDDAIVAPDAAHDWALSSLVGIPFRDALNNSDIIDNMVNDRSTIAHYGPIRGTDFVIVTEADVQAGMTDVQHLLRTRGFSMLAVMIVVGAFFALLTNNGITPQLVDMRDNMQAVIAGDLSRGVASTERHDEIGEMARSFVTMRDHVKVTLDDLRGSVDARVRDLQATQEVSRLAAAQRDMQPLMDQVVNAIADLFPNIYHAQIFITHEESQYAVLRASTGEAGAQLLARGHRLGVGSVSVIGQVTEEGRVVIARDIGSSDIHRPNELLPDTRAELAIPLRVGERVTGALDVQSREANSFTDAQISLLQTLADQIAVAIENARLYAESTRQLQALALTNQNNTYNAWREYMGGRRMKRLESSAGPPLPKESPQMVSARRRALQEGVAVVSDVTEHDTYAIAVPIVLRGQPLGTVEWEMPADVMSADTISLAEDLVNRLAVSIDNARLFQESRIAIDRERLVNNITARLTAQTDVNEILQTAVREIGQALHVPGAHIHLSTGRAENGGSNGNGKHRDEQ